MDTSIQPLDNIDQYVKRLNWYLQEHYPANKKITSEEWNALFLALIRQGNLQEETLERICNNYLPLQIEKVNILVDTANNHEGRIQVLRTDADKALKDSKYAIDTSNEALRRVMENVGTAAYIDNTLVHELHYTADPQTQIDNLKTNLNESLSDLFNSVQEDLKAYYTKDETYSRTEIDNKISLIPKFSIKVVTALPTENISDTTVYLVKDYTITSNLYTEYIYVEGTWEILGVQNIDLSNYLPLTGGTVTGDIIITSNKGLVFKTGKTAISVQSGDGNKYAVVQGSLTGNMQFGTPFGRTVLHGNTTRPAYSTSLNASDAVEIALLSDLKDSGTKIIWKEWE